YDAGAGIGEFYATDGQGNLGLPLQASSNYRKSWNQILAGRFTDSKYDSLLFYDQAAGTGEFYSSDGKGNIHLLQSHTDWRTTWTAIVAGKFTHSEFTDLLFYEGSTGLVELHVVDGKGGTTIGTPAGAAPLNFGAGWQQIVVGNFTSRPLQDLFLFKSNRITGASQGQLITTDGKGN